MARTLAALIAIGWFASFASAAGTSIDGLIDQLAAASYLDREAAGRELLKIGHPALPALEKSVAVNPDLEARQRATTLIHQIKRTLDTSKFLPPKLVKLDYVNVPLGTALADLKGKTGIPLLLDQQKVADGMRLVTVRTEEIPAWAAVEAFCQATGLKEIFREELGGSNVNQVNPYSRRGSYIAPNQMPFETASQVPVVLVDGKTTSLPGDRSSPVRVLALPAGFSGNKIVRGSGQVILNLDVTPLPSVKWDDVTAVRIFRAEDETGRPVTISQRSDSVIGAGGINEGVVFWGGQPQGQVMIWNGDMAYASSGPTTRANPRIVPVALRTDDRSIKMLKVFEGVVLGEVTLTNQTLATIDDLAKSVGSTANAAGDTKITLVDYKTEATNRIVIKVRIDTPNPYTSMKMNRRMAINPNWDLETVRPNTNVIKFLDVDGTVLPQPSTRGSSGTDDGIRQTNETEYVFNHRPGVKLPAKIQLVGNKPVSVEIPFKMQNVPLP